MSEPEPLPADRGFQREIVAVMVRLTFIATPIMSVIFLASFLHTPNWFALLSAIAMPMLLLMGIWSRGRLRRHEALRRSEADRRDLERSNSVLERQKADLERKEASLSALATRLDQSNRELQSFAYVVSHDLRAPLRLPANAPTVLARPLRLEQIFANLLDNAVKFQREGVRCVVSVECVERAGEWEFAVHDNSIGIEAKQFDKIFGIFQRLHSQDRYQGTGIGLAIVRKAVEEHGGKVWVESTPGKGSVFRFTLPRDTQCEGHPA